MNKFFAYEVVGSTATYEINGVSVNGVNLFDSIYAKGSFVTVNEYTKQSGEVIPAAPQEAIVRFNHYPQYFKGLTKEEFEAMIKSQGAKSVKAPIEDKPKDEKESKK